jgi:hypothetical protein
MRVVMSTDPIFPLPDTKAASSTGQGRTRVA